MSEKIEKLVEQYKADAHAMQTGVAYMIEKGSGAESPKHLRVGVNSAMVDHAGLAMLLIKKGIITEEEYIEAIADKMREEKERYEREVNEAYGGGGKIKLG